MALHDYEEHARQQTELASIKALKAYSDKKKKAKKAKKPSNKLTGDFNTEQPNIMKVSKRFNNKGTVLVGFSLDNKAWRFGHDLSKIHAKTVISVEDGAIYELPTALVHAFINEKKPHWIASKYGNFYNSKAYQINIKDLVEYCGSQAGYSV